MQFMISIKNEGEKTTKEAKRKPNWSEWQFVVALTLSGWIVGMSGGWEWRRDGWPSGWGMHAQPSRTLPLPPTPPAASQWNPLLRLRKKRSPSTVRIPKSSTL